MEDNTIFAFKYTAIGRHHIIKETICEDSSDCFSNKDEDKKYYIAIVADGHGATECFRSKDGSRLVVEIATECLKKFAENYFAKPEDENTEEYQKSFSFSSYYRNQEVKRLTDTIIYQWNNKVLEHYKNNPPNDDELKRKKVENIKAEDIKPEKLSDDYILHIYGTTLIAGLMLPEYLILIQQGDGRCEVFFEENEKLKIEQPIPWDERCEYNVTTSMCDEDVYISIRSHIVDLKKEKVIACYLGSDGVEDAYRDTYEDLGGSHSEMGGVHTFYKNLSSEIVKRYKEQNDFQKFQNDFQNYLEKMLGDFSKNGLFSRTGSGDDVSVAGIVDIQSLSKYSNNFEKDVKKYDLEEQLFWKEDELRGKSRKYGILENIRKETENRFLEYSKEYKKPNLFIFFEDKKDIEKKIKLNRDTYRLAIEYKKAIEDFIEYDKPFRQIQSDIKRIKQQLNNKDISLENQNTICTEDKKYLEEIQKLDGLIIELDEDYKDLEDKRKRAEEEARRKAEEAKKKAEEEARRKAEEAKKRAEEEARRKAEEAKKRAEEEARRKAEEAKKRAEEEARRKAEEAKKRAEEEARRKAEEAKKRAEEEARRKAEEAKKKAEEEARRKAEEAKKRAEEEAKKKAEREARLKAFEENRKQKYLESIKIWQIEKVSITEYTKLSASGKFFKVKTEEHYRKESYNNIQPL